MQNNKKITVLFILFLAVIFLLPDKSLAQADVFGTNDLADAGVNLGTRDLKDIIGGIVNIVLGFLGVLTTLIILYGGFTWMTSNGNADKIDRAKRIIINGAIGLLIVLSSYAIARFILREGYGGIFGNNGGGGNNGGFVAGVGLGAGALDSHYPAPNARDVARNTNIYATFKEPMDEDFIVDTGSCSVDASGWATCNANPAYINLYAQGNLNPITEGDLIVSYDTNAATGYRSFKFNPYGDTANHLGSPSANVRYRMEFGDLQTQNGESAFPYSNTYSWYFTTGTELDITPPRITSVRPVDGSTNPQNAVVQINFSEAVNPQFVAGAVGRPDLNIFMREGNQAGPIIDGEYKISNQYRTVEFITANPCGMNSCGGEVYCLPPLIAVAARVTELVEDMAENKLDSDGDEIGGENPDDIYDWTFNTTDQIDLVAPTISTMQDPNNLALDEPIEVTFDKPLLSSSVNSDNITLVGPSPINYWFRMQSGDGSDEDLNARTISIRHGLFDPSSVYSPTLTSGIKDTSQNCWYPCVCDDPSGLTCVPCNNPSGPCNGAYCEGS